MGSIGFDQKVPDVFYGPTALQRAKAAVEKGECARAKAEDERGYTYEVRRYEDGVACRRTYPLKVGDEVRYTRRTTGQVVKGTVCKVTTLPEHHEDAGKLAYRLGLSRDDAEAIGHFVVIPHSRVELVWPESAIEATGFVLLHEGRRLGWKILRGLVPTWHPDSRYYGHGPEAPPPTLCAVERNTFTAWDDAVTWCASFPAHPAETGNPPTPEDMQPERGLPPAPPAPLATPAPALTTTGLATSGLGRAWSPFVLIPGRDGAPYKAESRRDGEEPGTLERFTVWIFDDPRDDPHTHPWPFTSRILIGGYSERRYRRGADGEWREVGVYVHRAGAVVEMLAGDAHVVFDVLPGTTTHMLIGKLTAGAQDWGHLVGSDDGTRLVYVPVSPDPSFRARLDALNKRPV